MPPQERDAVRDAAATLALVGVEVQFLLASEEPLAQGAADFSPGGSCLWQLRRRWRWRGGVASAGGGRLVPRLVRHACHKREKASIRSGRVQFQI